VVHGRVCQPKLVKPSSGTPNQLFASKYKLVLPSEDELRAELDRERAAIEERLLDLIP
jgi:hypothetical protein